jgi:hypothetical protein
LLFVVRIGIHTGAAAYREVRSELASSSVPENFTVATYLALMCFRTTLIDITLAAVIS